MKIIIRYGLENDITQIDSLQKICFSSSELWNTNIIKQYLEKSWVIECKGKIIGVLLPGLLMATLTLNDCEIIDNSINPTKPIYGIGLICVHPRYRGKGLATKLIEKHKENYVNQPIGLLVREHNDQAIKLYKKMNYKEICIIKDKYYEPIDNGIFMVFNNNI